MDETGISTTSNKPPKVLSVKGKRQVGMIASAERGQFTTVIGCSEALHPLERIDLPESVIEASPSTESHDQPLSLTNATLQSDSIINPTQEENSPILESINPLTVSSPDDVESQTQSNDVPAVSPEPGTSKTYYSPSVLRPIPQPAKPITTRKRKLQRSSMLTSTPVKEEQKQKFEKARKTAMKSLDDVPNKASHDTAKANKKTVKPKISANKPKKTAKENKKQKKIVKFHNVDCIFCGEIYIEEDGQPTENWIQCNLCTQWCHEECSSIEGSDEFVCDNCNN
ncbi:hypothetical protein ILUMI_16771 [Ignelater luminosus]|uniref:Zinc finger PHD-type domain-containing protein n=1 Tax=Ignelater luminosus TaxID=2038154 RepID=A0A8K0CSA2_IGNLU|nr:hypothetical protein ILUMI_16771 [Ignelater luminosus]